jgi:RNA polymerase sigma-70 factor (ECF subfamily)
LEKEFLKIVESNQGIILKVCHLYCRHPEDTEDLFQEIIMQLWRSFPKFRNEAKVSTWIYRISLNVAITGLRKSRKNSPTESISESHQHLPDLAESGLHLLYHRELELAISSLNKFDKALMMLYLDERSYREMAEIMEISEGNIAVKINRIKQKLKLLLKPIYDGVR